MVWGWGKKVLQLQKGRGVIMSLNSGSKYKKQYYDHISGEVPVLGVLGKVFNLVSDISDRSGIDNEWDNIDCDVQDEIIDEWFQIISKNDDYGEN